MEQYIVSARKYRPATFASVVGQNALTATLKNAVATNRLAHSYLFCGSRGVGKTSCARIFAKTINCEHRTADGEACNECESCRAFNAGTSLNIIELDAASNNGVDAMKALIDQVQVPPSNGRYRVFIVDEVHMLTSAAFNAFLKTLEEPPHYVVFILATTEKQKIIPTILSRCQIYDFHRITVADMVEHMKYVADSENITADPAALNVIARKADGAMRDALSIFDQVAASSGGNITYQSALDNLNVLDQSYYNRLIDAFLQGKVFDSWLIFKEIRDRGFDSLFFINGLASYLRDLAVAADPATVTLIDASDDVRAEMTATASKCSPQFLLRAMNLCNEADLNYRTSSNKQFLIELTLAKICQLLSPSPSNTGDGEGRLQPIAAGNQPTPSADARPVATPKPAQTAPMQRPAAPVAPNVRTTPAPAAQRPVAPATAAPMPPRPGSAKILNTPGISIHTPIKKTADRQAETTAQQQSSADPATADNTPISADALKHAWEAYIDAHPKAHILINTMRSSCPVANDPQRPWALGVTVENDIQRHEMENAMHELLSHLRSSLSNSLITIDIAINQGAPPRHTLNDRELLANIVERYPGVKRFVDGFRLKLS